MSDFCPYSDNGGTVVAIAGDNFAVIGVDNCLNQGLVMLTKDCMRLIQLTPSAVFCSTGSHCDAVALNRLLRARVRMYQFDHGHEISTPALAQLLSIELYHKRFFPYYLGTVIAGLDTAGKGCVYKYDPVGSYERNDYIASGTSDALLQPILDTETKDIIENKKPPLTIESAFKIINDVFIIAARRDMRTGDKVYVKIITKDNIENRVISLKGN